MRTASILAFAAAAVSSANAYFFGFNLGAQVNGHCRSEAEWEFAFNKLASFPGNTKSVRLYASSDCNTLANAVPAALKTGTQLLVGIWTQDDAHFEAEKQALLDAIQQHGHDWILAVSVGVSIPSTKKGFILSESVRGPLPKGSPCQYHRS